MLSVVLPSEKISVLVKKYLLIDPGNKQNSMIDKFIPDGYISLVFNFGGKVSIIDDETRILLPGYFIIIPVSKTIHVEVNEVPNTIVAVCNASVFSRIFGIKLRHFLGGLYPEAEKIIPHYIYEAMKNVRVHSERISVLEQFLIHHLPQDYYPDKIDSAYNQIIDCYGVEQVKKLLEELDLNPRSFRRNFLERIGINAKALSRVVRVNYLWKCFLSGITVDFQGMVLNICYHDQAHLINDFKKIIGEPPSKFFKRDQYSVRIISGK